MSLRIKSLLALTALACSVTALAQTYVYGEVKLDELDYAKEKNYCVRLYCLYRSIDDGYAQVRDREVKLYRIYEGISEIDLLYKDDTDKGASMIVGRNLVHRDRGCESMDFFELTPRTILEKARRDKHFTLQTQGDTTVISAKGLTMGTAVRDTARHELRISYNALAPDTTVSLNLLIAKARLSKVDAEAVYHIDDNDISYVPQGNLKHISFEGDVVAEFPGAEETFHERTELYVDSVVYLTKSEYKASRQMPKKQRLSSLGYKAEDIDRLKQKLNVPPLTAQQLQRIEEQLDWEEELKHMLEAEKALKNIKKNKEQK